jgi:hypothetical protein
MRAILGRRVRDRAAYDLVSVRRGGSVRTTWVVDATGRWNVTQVQIVTAILFPSEPFQPRELDSAFLAERDAALAQGLEWHLVDHTRVTTGEATAATAAVGAAPHGAIYRGWMLKPGEYQAMYESLLGKAISLINTPAQYRTCHYLPESYAFLEGRTPKSTWAALEGAPSRNSSASSPGRLVATRSS